MGNQRFYADIMSLHPGVTGSCNLVIVKLPDGRTIRFVVDCGLFQEKEYESYNEILPFDTSSIEFCLVTHNHVDHIGRLPFMVKKGFSGRIYSSIGTSILMPLALNDSAKVLADVSRRKNKGILYNYEDVTKTQTLLRGCEYNETITINDNIKATFLINGHLMGAALILVQISYPEYEDINILFTGDYNNKNLFFYVPDIPEWILDLPLTIVQESTYGYMDSNSAERVFEKNVANCVNNNGTAVVPVFSLGRAQEMLYVIKCMQDGGTISTNVPIFFDGNLAMAYTNMYRRKELNVNPEMQDFKPRNLTNVNNVIRQDIVRSKNKKIILTTSGMGSYGPAQTYLPAYLSRKDTLIQFTGYTAEGTLGHRLKNTEIGETVEVGGLVVKKGARVEYTTEYSAHAKADEMISFLKQFNNLKLVLINHGQPKVKKEFAERVLEEVNPKMVGILGKDFFFRVNPFGLQKTLSSVYE